jgi:hypothetical protein
MMTRLSTKAGPMRLVQCDGFAVYAGAGPQRSQEPARRRLPPAARSNPRTAKRRATGAINSPAAVLHRPAEWSVGLCSVVFAAILMGLFGAYALGQYAALSGQPSGLVLARPVAPNPPLR